MWKILTGLTLLFVLAYGSPQVQLGGTVIFGRDVGPSKVEFFGGIPYAEPPVASLRFRSAVLKTRLNTRTFNASAYGKACLQPPIVPGIDDVSEDCLTINIHRPAGTKPSDKLPLLFWVYGGGFAVGSANLYNGSALVARSVERGTPIIYANFNYRLGPFGFPQGQEAYDRRELNIGLKDVIVALEWLQANIGAFGGDRRKITIFGESAGAMAISMLYFNKDFETLVRGAILESGIANALSVFTGLETERVWQDYVKRVPSCARLATSGKTFGCLQKVSQAEIATSFLDPAAAIFSAATVIDTGKGSLFPDFPSKLFEQGKFANIPYIAGTNLDEGTFFAVEYRNPNATFQDFRNMILGLATPPIVEYAEMEDATDRLLGLYPPIPSLGSPYRTGDELFGLPPLYKRASSLLGDITFDAPRRQWMEAASRRGVKGYGYMFSEPQPADPSSGVPHEAEIKFVHGTLVDPSPSAHELSLRMMDYWISFTVGLNPNDGKGMKRPIWPEYTKGKKVLLQLEGGNITTIPDNYRAEQIDFINSHSSAFRH